MSNIIPYANVLNDNTIVPSNEAYVNVDDEIKYVGEGYINDNGTIKNIFTGGYQTTKTGIKQLIMDEARAKDISGLYLDGNLKRTIEIDGTEYDVPDGMTPLTSIDNNATAYFDLGIPIGSSYKVRFDIMWNTLNAAPFFGAYNSGGSYSVNSFVGTYYTNANKSCFYANSGTAIGIFTRLDNTRYKLNWNGINAKPTLDGTELTGGSLPFNDITPSVNAYLCTRNQGGTAGNIEDMTIYGLDVDDASDNPLLRLRPAKNSSNVVGLYDYLNKTFISPVGTCLAGNEAPCPDFPLGVVGVGDKTENLLNPSNIHQGTIASATGKVITASNRCYWDYIPVKSGDIIWFSAKNNTPPVYNPMSLYSDTDEETYIGELRGTAFTFGAYSGYYFTATADAYVRGLFLQSGNFTPSDVVDAQVVIQATAPSAYVPYGYKFPMLKAENCGMVDMGTLTWRYITEETPHFFRVTISDKSAGKGLYTDKFTNTGRTGTGSLTSDNMICGSSNPNFVFVRCDSYTDATSFTNAMSGVYLYYQRTTDSSFTTPTEFVTYRTNPFYRIYEGGEIDLGDLTWTYSAPTTSYPYGTFATYELTGKATGTTNVYVNGYTIGIGSTDKRVWGNNSYGNIIVVVDSNYTDATAFKNAMKGIKLYYQTTSQSSWTAPIFDKLGFTGGDDTRKLKKVTLSAGTHTLSDALANSPYICTQQANGTLTGQVLTLSTGVTDADVIYVLATPTTETNTSVSMSTVKGDNYVECTNEFSPSSITGTYRRKTKE